jgi:aminoglycoside/choline kinase family phosphotransferase
MIDRSALAEAFIATTDWAGAVRKPLAGDASNRRYERLFLNGMSAVLMDAPREKGEDIRPFIRIARFLSGIGLSAPAILAQDAEHGFLLLEDLGDDLFARVIPRQPELERSLYEAATDALVHLHRESPPDDLKPYDPAVMLDMAALAWRWYLGGALAEDTASELAFRAAFAPVLQRHAGETPVLIQRDYHAENLLWLPNRDGPARVGLLDFQDAMSGHPAYDLVSVLQDARRDVPPEIEEAMIARYVTATGLDDVAFRASYAVLGVQRNLRILGVFGRLCLMGGKAHYVDLIPRVWGLMLRDLEHPGLASVAHLITGALPAPTPDILKGLKDKCATIPKP